MRLRELVTALSEFDAELPSDPEVVDLMYDSREVRAGSLFIAVPTVGGEPLSGGREFIADAVERGAVAVVAQGPELRLSVPFIRVDNARRAMADLAAAFFGHPSSELSIFAVTGTDGKTTTTYLLEQIFAAAGLQTGLVGTVGVQFPARQQAQRARMTTPESLDLQRLLREMVNEGVSHVALEASSHALALERLRGCRLSAAALTNIASDHLEFHGSWEAYAAAKELLFTKVAHGKPAVLNADDASFDRLRRAVQGPLLSYGTKTDAELRATGISFKGNRVGFMIEWQNESAPVELASPAIFNVSNGLAAAGLALVAGVPLSLSAAALSSARLPAGRLEPVDVGQPFAVVIDYAHTPQAFVGVLNSLRAQLKPGGQLIAVFGAAGDRDRAKRPELAGIAREKADFFIVTNEDPFHEDPEEIIEEIVAPLPKDEEGQCFERILDRGQALAKAFERARPGDIVAILGKGHEQSIAYGDRQEAWSDVAKARELLSERLSHR